MTKRFPISRAVTLAALFSVAIVPASAKADDEPVIVKAEPDNVRTERVSFNMKDPQKPGLLQSDENYVYVVMPVNL